MSLGEYFLVGLLLTILIFIGFIVFAGIYDLVVREVLGKPVDFRELAYQLLITFAILVSCVILITTIGYIGYEFLGLRTS